MSMARDFILHVAAGLLLGMNAEAAGCNADTEPVRVYIDSDAANEIDDPYAIYRALVAHELEVVGLSSIGWKAEPSLRQVSFADATHESQHVNEELLELTGLAKKISHPLGALSPLKDKRTPVDSAAARDIIAKARAVTDCRQLRVYTLAP